MESLDEENESEKIRNPNEKCTLIYTCSYCGTKLNTIKKNSSENFMDNSVMKNKNYDICSDIKCQRNLCKCSVCGCPIKLNINSNSEKFIYCIKCSHGGHFDHYQGWFKEFNECPNSKCDCRCQEDTYKNVLASNAD